MVSKSLKMMSIKRNQLIYQNDLFQMLIFLEEKTLTGIVKDGVKDILSGICSSKRIKEISIEVVILSSFI